jgi:hypothetical protein
VAGEHRFKADGLNLWLVPAEPDRSLRNDTVCREVNGARHDKTGTALPRFAQHDPSPAHNRATARQHCNGAAIAANRDR